MEPDQNSEFIISQLSKGVKPGDIIFDLCQKTGISWPEAEKLLNQVRSDKSREIEGRQFPLMFALALAIFLGGMGMLIYGGYGIFSQITLISSSLQSTSQLDQNLDALQKIYLVFVSIYQVAATDLFYLLLGAGMVLGSLIGMRDVWAKILPDRLFR